MLLAQTRLSSSTNTQHADMRTVLLPPMHTSAQMYGPGRSSTSRPASCASVRKRSMSAKPSQTNVPGLGSCRFQGTYVCAASAFQPRRRLRCLPRGYRHLCQRCADHQGTVYSAQQVLTPTGAQGVHAACTSLDAFGDWQVLLVPLCAAKSAGCQPRGQA